MAKIENPWGDGRDATVQNGFCCARPCLNIGENYGVFTQGCGYTQAHKNPTLVCMTRHLHGCPHPLPEPEMGTMRENVDCRHNTVSLCDDDLFSCPLWFCPNCSTYWLVNKPGPHLPGKTFRQLLDEQFPIP